MRYFELAVTLIVRYGGTVEKIIGDAAMDVVIGRRLKPKARHGPALRRSHPPIAPAQREQELGRNGVVRPSRTTAQPLAA